MYLGDMRYEEIKDIVSELLCDYGITELPIDVFKLCDLMGIIVIPYSQCSIEKKAALLNSSDDGMSCFDKSRDNRFVIYYNDENRSYQRQRFTIMHEIGHIVLNHNESNDITEAEANFFARNILVPLPIIMERSITSLCDIVKTFNVSFECASVVLKNLGTRLRYGHNQLKAYEINLVQLFQK